MTLPNTARPDQSGQAKTRFLQPTNNMNFKTYTELALRTEAPVGKDTVDRALQHGSVLIDIQSLGRRANIAKKAVFYGAPGEPIDSPAVRGRVRLLHAVFGIQSELGELISAVENRDTVNILEELGDIVWFVLLAIVACGFEIGDVLRANLAKLDRRHKGRFDVAKNANRDLDAERAALEGQS